MRVKLLVEYDGTAFCGWQIQKNGRTVQQEIETAIKKVTGETVKVTGSGRTDSGVHAIGQVAHFDTQSTVPADKFTYAINGFLPSDIRVLKSESVSEDFHARYSAKAKTYQYKFFLSDIENPLKTRYAVRVDALDLQKMIDGANAIVGEHDFKCFCATGSEVETTVRTVYGIDIKNADGFVTVTVRGNGFLYNMVRMIVGALKALSDGKIVVEDIKKSLLTGERLKNTATMPAKGLTLVNVEY